MCLKQLYVELSAVFYPAGTSLVSVKTFQVWLKSVISTHEVKASRSAPSCLLQTLITQLHFILSIFLFKWWKLPSFFPFCRLKSNRASSQQKPHRHRLSFIAIMFFLRCLSSRSVLLWWLQTGKKAWKTPWSNDSLKTWTLHSFILFLTIEETRVWFDC